MSFNRTLHDLNHDYENIPHKHLYNVGRGRGFFSINLLPNAQGDDKGPTTIISIYIFKFVGSSTVNNPQNGTW